MKKFFRIFSVIVLILLVVYFLGPHPSTPVYSQELPSISLPPEEFVQAREAAHKLKPDNQARIIWADSIGDKTDYSIVYLHGFSASQEEGDPVHTEIAKRFGCNLYLSRLIEHGIDTVDPLINFTPEKYWESAKESLVLGKKLGNKVILMATSTGASLAMKLASSFPNDVHALVMMSPNVRIFDKNAWLLNNPWGLQVARMILGSNYVVSKDTRSIYKQYWYHKYPVDAAVQLQEFLETSMNEETFSKIKQPTLMLYYYKDEIHQDSVVSVSAMKEMFEQLGTSADNKKAVVMPTTGNHVVGSYIKSKDVEGVKREIAKFLEDVLKMKEQE